jgi:hypothetical protein
MRKLAWAMALFVSSCQVPLRGASAETCLSRVDSTVERLAGYRWLWQMVDGRKCWYYSNLPLPKEDLVWSYTTEEFDSDVKVIERKYWINPGEDRM